MGNLSGQLQERFGQQVELIPFSDCHYWTGRLSDSGYGILHVDGKDQGAHRLSYEMHRGPIPRINGKSAHILHSCDNPMCVNPDHLRPGTHADNMADKLARGRQYRGERHHNRKLSDEAIHRLCSDIRDGIGTGVLAKKYGVTAGRIATIRHGHAFRDVLESVGGKAATGRSDRRLSDEQARDIYRRAHDGESNIAIAALHRTTAHSVADIKRGATYASVTGHRR